MYMYTSSGEDVRVYIYRYGVDLLPRRKVHVNSKQKKIGRGRIGNYSYHIYNMYML